MAHGFTVQGGLGAEGAVILHESSAHSVLVPDTELLFTAQFHRAGPDLILTGRDGQHHLIPGYFSSEQHPALVAPNGAHLSADTVDLLAGSPTPGHYAQAQPTTPPDAIGKIEKVVGDVSMVRNGVTVALHVGDAVFKSDVVQTGTSASCGISFPDGTALNLVANTRMALNDYAYDANSNANGALFTLVEGTFAFVAGKVAHSGDMKIATPVATMGIRGTTGVVQEQAIPPALATITATAADHTYTFAVAPDFGTGIAGMWDCYLVDANGVIQRDANGNPIVLVTVSQAGYVTYLTPQGVGHPPLVETLPVSNLQFAFQTRLLRDLADTLNLGNQNNGNNGSSTPPPFQLPNPTPQLREDDRTQTTTLATVDGVTLPATSASDPARPNTPTQTAHWQYGVNGNWNNPLDWSDAFAPFSWQNIVIGFAVTVTIDSTTGDSGPTATAVNDLTIDAGAILDIVSGGSLVVSGTLDDFGLVKVNSTGVDPTLTLNGPVIVEVGGEIEALGSLATVYFAANTVDNFGKIVADNYGQMFFEPGTTVKNEVGGQIQATDNGILTFEQTSVDNFGTIDANDYGQFFFESGTTVTNEVGGLVIAENHGTLVFDTGNTVINFGTLEAATGGTLTLDDNVTNHGQVLVQDGGTVELVNDTITGGQINLSSTGSTTDLEIAGVVTLTGGTVTLSDNGQNAIVSNGAAAELINYDSISGAGTIGDGNLTLDNFATIDATDASPLILDTGTNAIVNEGSTGILEASSGGTLDIESNVTNDGQVIAQHGGTVGLVNAAIAGGIVTVDGVLDSTGKSAIDGAAITVGAGGTLESTSGTLTIDPSSLDNGGELLATSGGTLVLDGMTVANTAGTVEADVASTLDLETTTISGGTLAVDGLLDSTGASAIDGAVISIGASGILEATSGTLTIDPGSINNFGLLEANGGTLEIDDTPVTSTGTIKATDNSKLVLNSETVTNGGTVQVDLGSTLELESATIIGGIVSIFGLLDTTGTCAIDDAAITNTGTIEVSALSSLTIDPSTITNTGGTITIDGTLTLDGVTLTGGTLDIDSGATLDLINTQIVGVDLSDLGTINVIGNSTIDGFSSVFGGLVTVASGQTLVLDNALLIGTVTNDGTVKVDIGAISEFAGKTSITGGKLINAGTVNADGTVTLDTVQVTNTGAIVVGDGTAADTLTLTDSTVTGAGTITITDHATVTLNGATINGGTIDDTGMLSVIASSEIENATVDGGGNLTVTNGQTLTLSKDTLDGVTLAGNFANADTLTIDNTVTLNGATINGGTIDDTGTLSVIASSEIENATVDGGGNLTVTNGQTLTLSKDTLDGVTLAGNFTNADTLTIDNTVTLNGATINGGTVDDTGTLSVIASSEIENATVNGDGNLTVANGQTLTLSKDTLDGVTLAGNFTNADTLTIDNTVTLNGATINGGTIDDTGTLSVIASSEIENATVNGGAVTVGAALTLDNDTVSGGTYSIAGGSITVQDTVKLGSGVSIGGGAITNDGTLEVVDTATLSGDTLANTDATLTIDAGATLTLDGDTINGGLISNSGTIDVTAASTIAGATLDPGVVTVGTALTLDNDTVSGGTYSITGGSITVKDTVKLGSGVSIGGGAITNDSTLEVVDTATLSGDTLTNTGATLTIDAGATLTLDGDTINGGTISNSGTIEVTAASTIAGATLDPGAVTVGAALTLDNDTVSGGTYSIAGGSITVQDTVKLGSGVSIGGGAITNDGTLEVVDTATLSGDTLTNTAATLTIDAGATLTLDGDTINGGTIDDTGTLSVIASSEIENATVNGGAVTVGGGVTLRLDGDTVSGTVFTDTAGGAILAVDPGASLTLTGVTVHGGGLSIGSAGAVDIENGSTTLDGVSVTNSGTINVDANAFSATLILDDNSTITGGTLTIGSSGLFDVEHGANGPNHGATLDGVSVTDDGALDVGNVSSGAILTLDGGTTVLVSGTLTINAGSTFDVDGGTTTIKSVGTVANNGVLEASLGGTLNIAGNINNSSGMLEAASGGLLDVETAIIGGAATIMAGTLEFSSSSSVNVTFDNSIGYGELILGNPEHFSGQISGFSGTAPDAAHSDQVELLNFTETGYSVQIIGGNQILTLHDAHGDIVTLTFDNFDATLDVSTSGGKTVIYDPPTEIPKGNSTTTATAAGDDHAAAPAIETAHNGNQSIPVLETGSFHTAANTAYTAGTAVDGRVNFGSPQNALSPDSTSSGDDHLVDLSKNAGNQSFGATVGPAEHGGDNVASLMLNLSGIGDEHGHVDSAALNPPAIGGQQEVDSPATGPMTGHSTFSDGGSLPIENGLSAAFTQTALTSLLNVIVGDHAMLGGDHGAASTDQTALGVNHANVPSIGTPSPFTSAALGADNFVFHPNLGDDAIHNTSAHAPDVGSISSQNGPQPSGLAVSVHELAPEFLIDYAHHDAADVSATVSQFQQMASSAHLLH